MNRSADDESTVGVFGGVPSANRSADDEATVGVHGAVPVTRKDIDDDKTESVFTPAYAQEGEGAAFAPAVAPVVTPTISGGAPSAEKKSKAPIIIIIAIILAIGIGVAAFIWLGRNTGYNSDNYYSDNGTTTKAVQSTDDDYNTYDDSYVYSDEYSEEYSEEDDNDENIQIALYFSEIKGLAYDDAVQKLNNAGVYHYVTYVYSSSTAYGCVVNSARSGWTNGSFAYAGDTVEILFSCGPVDDSWSYSEPDYNFDIIVEDAFVYFVSYTSYGEGFVNNKIWYYGEGFTYYYSTWDEVYIKYIQYTDNPINESDIPSTGYSCSYNDGILKVYPGSVQRWRCNYEIYD